MNGLSICLGGQVKEGGEQLRLLQVLSDQVWEVTSLLEWF